MSFPLGDPRIVVWTLCIPLLCWPFATSERVLAAQLEAMPADVLPPLRYASEHQHWQCNGFDKMQNATSFAEVTIQTAVRRFPDHLRTCTAHVTCAPSLPRWHAYVSA